MPTRFGQRAEGGCAEFRPGPEVATVINSVQVENLPPRGRDTCRAEHDAAVGDHHLGARLPAAGTDVLDRLDDIHSLDHVPKHDMLTVEPRRGNGAEEELRAVGVGAGIGHAQHAGASVLELEILVGELLPVDRFSTGAVVVGEVTALAHEVGDHTVERRTLVAKPLLAGAQGAEVLGCLRHHAAEEPHLDTTSRLAAWVRVRVQGSS